MREATPPSERRESTADYHKKLYNYNYKDKWDKSLAQAGMSSSLEPPDLEPEYGRNRKNSRKKSTAASSESSAWGKIMNHVLCNFLIFSMCKGSKYDQVDEDRSGSNDGENENNKAWFVEF